MISGEIDPGGGLGSIFFFGGVRVPEAFCCTGTMGASRDLFRGRADKLLVTASLEIRVGVVADPTPYTIAQSRQVVSRMSALVNLSPIRNCRPSASAASTWRSCCRSVRRPWRRPRVDAVDRSERVRPVPAHDIEAGGVSSATMKKHHSSQAAYSRGVFRDQGRSGVEYIRER